MSSLRPLLLPLALLSGVLACGSSEKDEADSAPVLSFESAPLRLVSGTDTLRVYAQLAERPDQMTLGLMERRHLADSAGMLFIYHSDQPATAGFWMFRTRIPLDIAFADSLGTIRAIQHMLPCPSDLAQGCPSYAPGVPYRVALEVNAGFLARHTLTPGSRIVLSDTSRRERAP